jgi:hypothetical protein
MNDSTILLEIRTLLTNRADEQIDWQSVRLIDGILCAVQPGVNNAVDLALGRTCATLPVRADYGLSAADIVDIEARCNEQASDGPQHEGMWM